MNEPPKDTTLERAFERRFYVGDRCTRCGRIWPEGETWAQVTVEIRGFGDIATPLNSIELWCPECIEKNGRP